MGFNYYSNFPNTGNPFFERGGGYNNETNAGVFYFNNMNGNNDNTISFRVVVPVLRYRGKLKMYKEKFSAYEKYVYGHIVGSIKEV